MPVIKRN